jgi:hypothetical protein
MGWHGVILKFLLKFLVILDHTLNVVLRFFPLKLEHETRHLYVQKLIYNGKLVPKATFPFPLPGRNCQNN